MEAEEKLNPARRLFIGIFVLAMAATGFAAGRILLRPNNTVRQPIQFNHRKHVEEAELECVGCHQYYPTGQHSGLPAFSDCLICHDPPITDSPEEKKLLDLAKGNSGAGFRKLFRLPNHVYYSHREHVTIAGLECKICHGEIAATTVPPPTPLVRITMDTCVNCHAKRGVNNDCTRCHR